MKRRIAAIVVFLLLGAIVNVAVATASARWTRGGNTTAGSGSISPRDDDRLWWARRTGVASDRLNAQANTRTGYELTLLRSHSGDHAARIASGWPILAMEGAFFRRRTNPGAVGLAAFTQEEFNVFFPRGAGYAIPLKPRPRGFAFNTLFYALLMWIGVLAHRDLRTRLRRRGGCCLSCAYDLRGGPHERCPECGRAVVTTE